MSTPRTRLERSVDPDQVRKLEAPRELDLTPFGPHLAAALLAADLPPDLLDELHAFVHALIARRRRSWLPRYEATVFASTSSFLSSRSLAERR